MGRSLNILLIEDNADDVLFFQRGLNNISAKTIHVPDAETAIAYLAKNPLPDLIVTDLRLPGISVEGLLNWVRSNPNTQKVPIVVYTGALRVPEEVKSAVRQIFSKSSDLAQTRLTAPVRCCWPHLRHEQPRPG
jgi:CheY-like chemotaxis protein